GARAVVRGQPLDRVSGSSRSIADGARGSPTRLGSQRHDYESPGPRRPGHGPFGPAGTRLPIPRCAAAVTIVGFDQRALGLLHGVTTHRPETMTPDRRHD